MKSYKAYILGLAAILSLGVSAPARDVTVIVAPVRYSVMQVGFDLIQKRDAVLVSYANDAKTGQPLLHAWDAAKLEWVYISLQDYHEMKFLDATPKQVVMLGDETVMPAAVRDATVWTRNKVTLTRLDNASLVNEFGRLWKWKKAEWQWFSKRYNLTLQDESEPYRNSSWYDQAGPLKRSPAAVVPSKIEGGVPPPADVKLPPTKTAEPPPAPVIDVPVKADDAKLPPVALPPSSPKPEDTPVPPAP